jgi:O-antigen ligase
MPEQKTTSAEPKMYWIKYFYAGFIILMPFIYSPQGADPVLLPRQIALCLFVLTGSGWLLLRLRQVLTISNSLPFLFAALPVVYAISIFQAVNTVEAWYITFKITLFCSFFWVMLALVRQGYLSVKTISLAVAISGLIATIWAVRDLVVLQSVNGDIFEGKNIYKVNATFGHKNLLSAYIFLCFPMVLVQWVFFKKSMLKIVIIISASLLMLSVILLLQTRAVLFALGVSAIAAILLLLFSFPILKRAQKRIAILFVLGGALLAGSFLYLNRAKLNIITQTESFTERANLWNNTWEMINEQPLAGVGAGNWQIHFSKYGMKQFYKTNYTVTEGLTTFQRPHNDFLWVWSETGIAGLLVFGLIFIFTMTYTFRLIKRQETLSEKFIHAALFIQVLSYIIISLVDFPLERIEHPVVIVSSIALIAGGYAGKNKGFRVKKWVWAVVILFSGYTIYVCSQRWKSELQLKMMYKAHASGDWQNLIKEGNRAQTDYFNMDYYSIPVKWYVGVGQFMLNDLVAAKKSFEEAYRLHPNQVHVLNNYGTCFEKEGNHTRAIELLEEAHRISPTFSDGIINLSGAYFNAGRYDDAYNMIKTFRYDEYNDRFKTFALAIIKVKLEDEIAAEKNKTSAQYLAKLIVDDDAILKNYREAQSSGKDVLEYIKEQSRL